MSLPDTTKDTHFKDSVSYLTRHALKILAEYIHIEFEDQPFTAYCDSQMDIIQGCPCSGFIPFQDGGYSVSLFTANNVDSSDHFTTAQTEWVNEQINPCLKAFLEDNKLPPKTTWNDFSDEQQNDYGEYEYEWFEPALLQFECWVNGGKILVRFSIHYKDAPYHLEKYGETIF